MQQAGGDGSPAGSGGGGEGRAAGAVLSTTGGCPALFLSAHHCSAEIHVTLRLWQTLLQQVSDAEGGAPRTDEPKMDEVAFLRAQLLDALIR